MDSSPDLPEALKLATSPAHERLESTQFIKALHGGELSKVPVVNFMRALSIIHAVLERSVGMVLDPVLIPFLKDIEPKLPFLMNDLRKSSVASTMTIGPAIQQALGFGSDILKNSDDPCFLLGVLYVLEGSQNGGTILKKIYAHCLELPLEDLTYFGCYGPRTASVWKSFVEKLNSLSLKKEDLNKVVNAAVLSFEWLEKIISALYPFSEESLAFHISTINPEAGDHSIPQDPRKIEVALRAGQKAWKKFAYLEQRFGERGKRFTSSDSCWLLSLCDSPPEIIKKRLSWLRTILSSRGIPSIILECHIMELRNELMATSGETSEASSYNPFLTSLRVEREKLIDQKEEQDLIANYNSLFHLSTGFKVPSPADLLASCWIDEKSGIKGSLGATLSWFTDIKRFSADWIRLANLLIDDLQSKIGSS
jgi:heme oxygenase